MVLLQQVLDLICSVSVRPISKALGNWLLLQRSLHSLEIDLCLRGHVPLSEPQVSTEHRGDAKAHLIWTYHISVLFVLTYDIYIYMCVYDDNDDDDDHDHDHDLDDIYVPFIVCICSTQHPRTAKCIVSTCRCSIVSTCRCMHAHTCMAVYRQTGIDASNRTAHTIPLHAIALHTVALHDHCTIPCHSIYMHILIIPQILVHLNILIYFECVLECVLQV